MYCTYMDFNIFMLEKVCNEIASHCILLEMCVTHLSAIYLCHILAPSKLMFVLLLSKYTHMHTYVFVSTCL